MVCSLPGSSVHGILQARILEWVAMPSSRGSSWPRDQTGTSLMSPALAGRFFTTSTTWGALKGGRHSSGFIEKGAGPCSDKAKCLSMPCPCYLASSGNSQTWPTEQESQVRNWVFPIETASVSAWPKSSVRGSESGRPGFGQGPQPLSPFLLLSNGDNPSFNSQHQNEH